MALNLRLWWKTGDRLSKAPAWTETVQHMSLYRHSEKHVVMSVLMCHHRENTVVFPRQHAKQDAATPPQNSYASHAMMSWAEQRTAAVRREAFVMSTSRDGTHIMQQYSRDKHKKQPYRSTCSSPGVTVPCLMTPVPLRVPSWTWKTGRRERPEDCNRVFSTSRGQVMMAPTVPLHLDTPDQLHKHKD